MKYFIAMKIAQFLPFMWSGAWLEFCGLGEFHYDKAVSRPTDQGIVFGSDVKSGRWVKIEEKIE